MAKNSAGIEGDLIIHLEVAGDQISEAIELVKAGKALTAHEKIETAYKRLLAAESLFQPKSKPPDEMHN